MALLPQKSHRYAMLALTEFRKAPNFRFLVRSIVEHLHEQILREMQKGCLKQNEYMRKKDDLLLSKARQNLRDMPRKIQTELCELPGTLKVSWIDPEGWEVLKLYG